ncbi:unnamed protein product [Sphagnum jensenii]|uniref:Auxin efflux carrier component n=1 Tax=Sphagnum jensenii TaxID=128206 RepID=A0ABP0VNX3_9BRYO
MITGGDLYNVLSAVVPLYVAMMLAYGSVKWWGILTPQQCMGVNRFVSIFAVPLLSFQFIAGNDPYAMNFRFIAADAVSKVSLLLALALWARYAKSGSLDWMITIFMLGTIPNTLVMGTPLLAAMYGAGPGSLTVQAVVLQCIIWYTLLLVMYEYRAARILIMEQFPDTAGSIASFKVDSDVISLDGTREPLPDDEDEEDKKDMPPTIVMVKLISVMTFRKLIRNPNTYSSIVGVVWSLLAFRWHFQMPLILHNSVHILSDAGLGMAMFSLGLFMGLQERILVCGTYWTIVGMGLRFLLGPALFAAASLLVGLRGVSLHVSIVQAALPQGIVPFVFAREYNVHPDILSTAVIFGMLIALPISLLYYILLGL